MKKKGIAVVLAMVVCCVLASNAYADVTVPVLNLVASYGVDDGEGVGYDPITGGFVTTAANQTDLRFYNSSGVFQSALTVLPAAANPARLVAVDVLPTGNIMVTDRNDGFTVYEVHRGTGVQATASVVPAGMTYPYGMDVNGTDRWAGDKTSKDVQKYNESWTPVGPSWNAETQASLGGAGVDDLEGMGIGPNGNMFVADDGGGRVLEFTTDGTFVAEYGMGGYGFLADPEGISADPDTDRLYVSNDDSGGPAVAVFTRGTAVITKPEPPAPTPFRKEYMVIGTSDDEGGDAIYQVDTDGTLTFLKNMAGVDGAGGIANAARSCYYHVADDTLYFTEGDSPAEVKVGLADLLANGTSATVTRINGFDALGGGEGQPDILVKGPQDGLIYAHTRGAGRLYQYNPLTDVATSMGAHTAHVDTNVYSVVYGNTLYAKVGDDGFKAWDQAGDGSWGAPYDVPMADGVLGAQAMAIRQSDGMYFSGRSGSVKYGYITGDQHAGGLAKLDDMPVRLNEYQSLELSADEMKLWVCGHKYWGGSDWVVGQWLGYYDISGDSYYWDGDQSLWHLVYAPGDMPDGLTGADWRISIVATPIPEPAGLGLVGLALLGLRRRRS